MTHRTQLEAKIQEWTAAGLIDAETATRILAHEVRQEQHTSFRWPVFLAMVFGGILFAAGATLFVAAHWADLSPAYRFSLVLAMVGVLHFGGAALSTRFTALSTTLHALGTATLGAAIFLTAQIFNLHENWATGVLLWSIGAATGFLVLRDWPQAALLALLSPAWLISQWTIATEWHHGGNRPLALGLLLTALSYLSARIGAEESTARRTMVWIGGICLLPCASVAIFLAMEEGIGLPYGHDSPLSFAALAVGWAVAVAAPLLLAWTLRGPAVWMNAVSAVWACALIVAAAHSHPEYNRNLAATLTLYGLCALGSVGLVAWGLHERRKERLNLGITAFAISVLFFYFDSFMGKLGRSVSLLILGLLCLAVGYLLEVTRRRLLARMEMNP